jgi:mycothiol synthase
MVSEAGRVEKNDVRMVRATNESSAVTGLPPGYTARPPRLEDADAVAALIAACQQRDTGRAEISAEEVAGDWQGIDLAHEALAIFDPDGQLVAEVEVLNRDFRQVLVYGYVHPNAEGRGLGRVLVNWAEDWARERMHRVPGEDVEVRHYINGGNPSAPRLMSQQGYEPVRGVYVMEVDWTERPPQPEWPDGIRARQFELGKDEEAAYEAVEDSFRDHWGRTPNTLENLYKFTAKDLFRPDFSFLAYEGSSLAGVILCEAVSGRVWVATIGVRRQWRRRGLGLALLLESFGRAHDQGIRRATLSVDSESPTNAPALYERAGMRVSERFVVYQKTLPAAQPAGATVSG